MPVATDIKIPDIGTRINSGILNAYSKDIVVACNVDDFIIPAIIPIPINSTATGIILDNPKVIYSLVFLNFPLAVTPTIPPTGSVYLL